MRADQKQELRKFAAKVVVRSPRSLEIGSELSAMGIPLGELIDELELLQPRRRS